MRRLHECACRQHDRGQRGDLRRLHGLSRFNRWAAGAQDCVPACIVDSKVTSHIGGEKPGGDLFLTGCDYEWKPLCFAGCLPHGGLRVVFADAGLFGCGVGRVAAGGPCRAAAPCACAVRGAPGRRRSATAAGMPRARRVARGVAAQKLCLTPIVNASCRLPFAFGRFGICA
ncbi:hypothetical protein C6Q09_29595 [Burkholderia multivorans]|nr:hypothetical protein C6Q09_29595 [Burkholderia multivorans]